MTDRPHELLIKICCISSVDEADMALQAGADALGLVSAMPSGPGVIDEALIGEIADHVGDSTRSVLLTSLGNPAEIAEQALRCRVNAIQLCEWLDHDARRQLRALLPSLFLMQVIHVTGPAVLAKVDSASSFVDAILLDSGTLAGPKIELGGTGRTHDWALSREIRRRVSVPLFLAGGLSADNVARAIQTVEPAGVDICSGVRTAGVLDREKLSRFVEAARGANSSN